VNVGGNVLKMDRLRELWSELGFSNVRTYVQSGNVVFESRQKPAAWLPGLERSLEALARLPVSVIIRTPGDLSRIIAVNPFLSDPAADPKKLHVVFLSRAAPPDAAAILAAVDIGGDHIQVVGAEIFCHCPGGFAEFKLTNKRIEKLLSVKATVRNWTTVNKLHELASS
jgi:uncharacterized protein (DUF1697 family)